MPKTSPLKALADGGPVAARTRLKLGSPMHTSKPIQYPESWPLLHKAVLYSNLPSPRIVSPILRASRDAWKEKKQKLLMDARRKCRQNSSSLSINTSNSLALHIDPWRRRIRQRARVGKKIRGSFVDFVTIKSRKGANTITRKGYNKSHRKSRSSSRKSRRTAKYKGRRKFTKRRKGKRQRAKSRKPKRGRSTRRRKVTSRKRKKRSRRGSTRRTHRKMCDNNDSVERGRTLEPEPHPGHAYDYMLRQKNAVNIEACDAGHDEIKDDPLNIGDICRSLVKSLPGVPADCREENFDEKTTKPEHQKRERIVLNIKNTEHINEGEDQIKQKSNKKAKVCSPVKKKRCIKEVKALTAEQAPLRNHRSEFLRSKNSAKHRKPSRNGDCKDKKSRKLVRRRKRVSQSKHKRNSPCVDTSETQKENTLHTSTSSEYGEEKVEPCNSRALTIRSLHNTCERSDDTRLTNDLYQQDSKAFGQEQTVMDFDKTEQVMVDSIPDVEREVGYTSKINKEDNTGNTKLKKTGKKSGRETTIKKTSTDEDDKQTEYRMPSAQNHRWNRRKLTRKIVQNKRETSRVVPQPYHGKPVPRNRRREEIDIIRMHSKDISLLAKRVAQAKKNAAKRQRAKNRRNPKRLSSKRRQKSAAHRTRNAHSSNRRLQKSSAVGSWSSRKRNQSRQTTGNGDIDSDDNGNNNVNNNQTDWGAWGRVSGRLLRIGRYLLRKFRFFLW